MRYLGFPDAHVTPDGADGGIDVRARDALAQVKFKASQVGGPEMQRLFGARGTATEKQLLFFTGTSYSSKATEYAAQTGIALFIYDWVGDVEPANSHARRLLAEANRPPEPEPVAQPTPPPPRTRGYSGHIGTAPAGAPSSAGSQPENSSWGVAGLGMTFGGMLAMVGIGAVLEGAQHAGIATILGLLGLGGYLFGLLVARRAMDLQLPGSPGLATAEMAAAGGVAAFFWIGLAIAIRTASETGAGIQVFVIAAVLVIPVLILLTRPRRLSSQRR